MSSAGHVGGAVSPASLFNLKVSSKPKPLGPSDPVNLAQTHRHRQTDTHTRAHSRTLKAVLLYLCSTSKKTVKMRMLVMITMDH